MSSRVSAGTVVLHYFLEDFACFRSFNIVEIDDGQEYEPFNIWVVVFREGTLSFIWIEAANNEPRNIYAIEFSLLHLEGFPNTPGHWQISSRRP